MANKCLFRPCVQVTYKGRFPELVGYVTFCLQIGGKTWWHVGSHMEIYFLQNNLFRGALSSISWDLPYEQEKKKR